MHFLPLLLVTLSLVLRTCAMPTYNSKMFSQIYITAEKNRTGFWNQKVLMEHGATHFASLSLNVDYDYSDCGKTKNLRMTFTITPLSASKGSVPSQGYLLEGRSGLYKLHEEALTWSEAADVCTWEGAHLAVPNSRQEAEDLLAVARRPKGGFHVGVRDKDGQGTYCNIFGVPVSESGFSLWSLSEPDPRTSGCVVLEPWGYLDSVPCGNSTRPFVCEKEMISAAINSPLGIP